MRFIFGVIVGWSISCFVDDDKLLDLIHMTGDIEHYVIKDEVHDSAKKGRRWY